MPENIDNKIIKKFRKAGRGALFFTDNFLDYGNARTVSKVLERLVKKGEIIRVARGIYTRPKKSTTLGTLYPSAEEIARAVARKYKARIIPTGTYALNILGLSTQVPVNVVFLTDGPSRIVKLSNRNIMFKQTAPRNLGAIGKISGIAVQALKTIGKDNITETQEQKIIEQLKKEDVSRLKHDMQLAPEWIRKIMRKALINNG